MKFDLKTTIIAVLLLILVNTVSYIWLPVKFDMTQNKAFTLSKATTQTLAKLDDIVRIDVYMSSNLPAYLLTLKQSVKDMLAEYSYSSHGKLKVNFLSPDKNSEQANEAIKLGIPELQFSNVVSDKYEVTKGFLGLSVLYEDKKEIIPALQSVSNLEYELTSTILKASQKQRPVVGLTIGHGEVFEAMANPNQPALINQVLGNQFIVENYNIASGSSDPVPDQFSALIIAGPTKAFDEKNQQILEQFITRGKPVLFFLDGITVDSNLQANPANHNLFGLLEKYGITLSKNLVLDPSSAMANFSSGVAQFFTQYPYWVKILPDGINQTNPASFGIQGLVLPWVSSIDWNKNNSAVKPLVFSSPKSWMQSANFNLDPTQKWQPTDQRSYPVAVLYESKSDQVKFLVVADSEMVRQDVSGQFAPNWHFLLNVLEYLTSSINLSSIQVKQEDIRPLAEISSGNKDLIKIGSIAGIPAFIGLVGAVILLRREKQKSPYKA
jgi:ABC-2 type transport system permease protein